MEAMKTPSKIDNNNNNNFITEWNTWECVLAKRCNKLRVGLYAIFNGQPLTVIAQSNKPAYSTFGLA